MTTTQLAAPPPAHPPETMPEGNGFAPSGDVIRFENGNHPEMDEATTSNGQAMNGNQNGIRESLTFDEVRERVFADDKSKWDIVLPRQETILCEGRLQFPDCDAYDCPDGVTLSPWATSQICSRLNIPTAYFRRCPTFLQDAQYNHWNVPNRNGHVRNGLARNGNGKQPSRDDLNGYGGDESQAWQEVYGKAAAYPEEEGFCSPEEFDAIIQTNGVAHEPDGYTQSKSLGNERGHQFKNGIYAGTDDREYWLLRAREDSLRAVLTDRYTPLDNRTLLDALFKTLPRHLEAQWLALDDESFHLRIIDRSLCMDVLPGDPIMSGIHIANSEVGKRSVTVDALVYRQICKNGMIRLVKNKSILNQRHIAVSPPHFVALLKQGLSQALSASMELRNQMQWATGAIVPDVEAEMKSLAQSYHLGQSFMEDVQSSLQKESSPQQDTVYGLVNALTQAAQSLDTESRYDMEIVAGKWLERKSMAGLGENSRKSSLRVPASMANGNGRSSSASNSAFGVDSANQSLRETGVEGESANVTDQDNQHAEGAIAAAEVLFEAEAVDHSPSNRVSP